MKKIIPAKHNLIFSLLLLPLLSVGATTGTWSSVVTGGNITYTVTEPSVQVKDAAGNNLTVVYLENMGFAKIGQNANLTDVNWLLSKGYRVIELDYTNNVNAVSPQINSDIIAINDAIYAGSFCGLTNCSKYRSYVLFEGYRIARDVSYFLDNPTVYNYPSYYTVGDSIYMDIIYPANASVSVPVVLSFSYSNSYAGDVNKHQRLNLGNTLATFNDSFLEGAPAKGIAWAIADHPKYCDWGQGKPVGGANKAYGSYQTNPDAAQKVKSAVRTLRSVGSALGLSGKIGIYGFSRGSTAGSMAIGDKTVSNFENAGINIGVSEDVQAAALGSGVFDYTLIFNTEESDVGNLRTNCPLGWGPLSSNTALWESQGSSYLVETAATAPVIFFYNTDDALYYQDQIAKLTAKLNLLGVPNSAITNYGTGHSVPQTQTSLSALYGFFNQYLTPPDITTGSGPVILNNNKLNVIYSPQSSLLKLQFNIDTPQKVELKIYNTSGDVLYKAQSEYLHSGIQYKTIRFDNLQIPKGVYFVKVSTSGSSRVQKFRKD